MVLADGFRTAANGRQAAKSPPKQGGWFRCTPFPSEPLLSVKFPHRSILQAAFRSEYTAIAAEIIGPGDFAKGVRRPGKLAGIVVVVGDE